MEGVPRKRDQRKYRSQCMYLYHLYELSHGFPSTNCTPMDFLKYQAATYELTKLDRKLRTFWYYEGRHLSFEEAVNLYTPDALEAPKYRPKLALEIPPD